jgi:hypothetical protein
MVDVATSRPADTPQAKVGATYMDSPRDLEHKAPEPEETMLSGSVDNDESQSQLNETPNVEEPNVEEPNVEEPNVEEPNVEEPNVEEPDVEEPDVEKPDVEKPDVEQLDVEVPDAVDLAILEGKKVNKVGNITDENGRLLGRVVDGITSKLVGKKCDADGKIWSDARLLVVQTSSRKMRGMRSPALHLKISRTQLLIQMAMSTLKAKP